MMIVLQFKFVDDKETKRKKSIADMETAVLYCIVLLLRGHPERSYLIYLYGRKNLDVNQVSRDEFMRK